MDGIELYAHKIGFGWRKIGKQERGQQVRDGGAEEKYKLKHAIFALVKNQFDFYQGKINE